MPTEKITAPTQSPGTSTRGHVEEQLSTKIRYCLACGAKKPARGGWVKACEKDGRQFMGGEL